MTKEEILAMEAGEELDSLVIKELMHHEWDEGERPRCKICGVWRDWGKPDGCEAKHYSTSISAAWQVVKKVCNWAVGDNMLILKGQSKDPASTDPDDTGEWWEVEINGDWGMVTASGETAPEAICKAALLAKYSEHNH